MHRPTLTLVTDAAKEPVTLAEQKAWMREVLEDAGNDLLIANQITATRKLLEKEADYALLDQTWRLTLDAFPKNAKPIKLWRFPVSSVTQIQYVDDAGATQTWSNTLYAVDTDSNPGRVEPAFGQVYPVTRDVQNAVTVTFVAGYGTELADVPEDFRSAIKILATHYYENRELVITGTIVSKLPDSVARIFSPGMVLA